MTDSRFPEAIDNFPDLQDGVDEVLADHQNWPDDAIEKLERFVGVRPWWWTWASVVEAITWLYYRVVVGGAPAPPTPSGLTYQPEPSGMTVLVDFSIDTAHRAAGFDYFKVYYADDASGTNATAVGWFRGMSFNLHPVSRQLRAADSRGSAYLLSHHLLHCPDIRPRPDDRVWCDYWIRRGGLHQMLGDIRAAL